MGKWQDLGEAVKLSIAQLNTFVNHHHGLRDFLREQTRTSQFLDHIAVKAHNAADYDFLYNTAPAYGSIVGERIMDERRVFGLAPHKPIITTLGPVLHVECMEPRPGASGPETFGLDHMEFYLPHSAALHAIVNRDKLLRFENEHNDKYRWKAIHYGLNGELRFSSIRLPALLAQDSV